MDWCWSWNSNTLATSCEELTHWKRTWWWERLGAGGEGDDRGWDGWMASPTQWTWVSAGSRSWWWTGRPGVLRFMGSQRVGRDWATELNWTENPFCQRKSRGWVIGWKGTLAGLRRESMDAGKGEKLRLEIQSISTVFTSNRVSF